ncbi:MAG: hypothetical protein IJM18_02845 [Clostridia bacterium]|nr:hypothetical protein [Clostridia bacterium]
MKRIFALILLVITVCSLAACSKKANESAPEAASAPITASMIKDGEYEIEVESSSSMFKVVKCVITVKDGSMTAALTMSGQGYGYLFMGKSGDAPAAPDETNAIPFTLDADGAKVFTVPLEALDKDIDCAAWSIKKETWYDRVLVFKSEGIPEDCITK